MSDKLGPENCNCSGHGAQDAQAQATNETLGKLLRAEVPQTYETKLNIRLVPGPSLETAVLAQPRCKPRGHSPGWSNDTGVISPDLLNTLKNADKLMVAWLAKDTQNAQSFLANPIAAMREAGLELTRVEEKALARSVDAAKSARVVGPGVNISAVSVQAYPAGRVGELGPLKPDVKPIDFGCGAKRKGQ